MLTETAYAKVNLALHVRRRRDDGYHDIETVFAFCGHGDTLEYERGDACALTIDGPFADGLSTTDNLVLRAAASANLFGHIHLTKNLPVASGIGGGSADAAAVLRVVARLSGQRPDMTSARMLGADVPACIASETVRGEGAGDVFHPAASVTGTPILLVNPRVTLSTGAVFAAWDGVDRGPLGDWRTGRNDLEAPARTLVPEVGDVIAWLDGCDGVTLARMSGSGATCFALFETIYDRDEASARTGRDRPGWWAMASTLR